MLLNFRCDIPVVLYRITKYVGRIWGTAVAQWLKCCATVGDGGSTVVRVLRYKLEGVSSIPDGVRR
jgi:hypothetical protein